MTYVRTIRLQLGLSQIELAEKLGVKQPTISRLENDGQPLDARTKLALEALLIRHDGEVVSVHDAIDTVSGVEPSPGKEKDFTAGQQEQAA